MTLIYFGCATGIAFVCNIYPAEKFNVLEEGYIAFVFMILYIFFQVFPLLVFYFIYIIEAQNLVNWARTLQTKIGSLDFMHSLTQYVIALDYANDSFSFNIFFNVCALSKSVIISVFRGANSCKFNQSNFQSLEKH